MPLDGPALAKALGAEQPLPVHTTLCRREAASFQRHAKEGERDPEYSEITVSEYMKNQELTIRVEMGLGSGRDRVWTCDLTHAYIDINADYRT